ncbi:UNVERIFIED_CONTAM: Ovochymase-1 [Siphonaria sp. JEL0065]|nr:Ovochymase-1 [Siphonaria sp. JEL0065]
MIARVLVIALATAASVFALPGGGVSSTPTPTPTPTSSVYQAVTVSTVTVTYTQWFTLDCTPTPTPKKAPFVAPIANVTSIVRTDPGYVDSLQWSPSQGTGLCHGSYAIPSALLNGVIAANSNDDGSLSRINMTYSNNMACQWKFHGPAGYVAVLEFAYIDTECGWDFVLLYDGSPSKSNLVGQLCGNRNITFGYSDLFVSSTNVFAVQFMSDSAVTRRGFLAVFNFVRTFNTTQFLSRELHAAVYDSARDIMIVTAGHTLKTYSELLNDVLIYNFSTFDVEYACVLIKFMQHLPCGQRINLHWEFLRQQKG